MKKKIFLLGITATYLLLINSTAVFAQIDFSKMLESGPDDATKLGQAYLSPLFKGVGAGLNYGWNNTARVKKVGHFELRVSASGAIVPIRDESFDVTKIGLSSNMRPTNSNSVIAPTVVGGDKAATPQMDIHAGDQKLGTITLPQGLNFPLVPAPQVQATIGLPKGIDVTLRLMPKINLGKDLGSVYMIGGGVKVDLMRIIKGETKARELPFDLALAAGYTQLNYNLPVSVEVPAGAIPKDANQSTDFTNQSFSGRISGVNIEAIISKKLLFFTPFLSMGYHSSRTKVGLKGNYPFITGVNAGGVQTYTSYTDPVTIDQRFLSGMHANAGFQLQFLLLRFYASYSVAAYQSVNAGIGFGIGK